MVKQVFVTIYVSAVNSPWGMVFGNMYQGQMLISVTVIMQFLEVPVELWDGFYTYVSIP